MRLNRLFIPAAAIAVASACAPTAVIQNIMDGQSVSGVVTIDNEVTSDKPVTAVEDISGTDVPLNEQQDGVIDTGTLANGEHTITLNAANADGTATDSVTVNVSNPLVPNSAVILGDSLCEQTFDPLGLVQWDESGRRIWQLNANAPEGVEITCWRGWTTATPEIRQAVIDAVAAMKPEVLVIALGANESSPAFFSSDPGFTQADRESYQYVLDQLHANTTVVFVLPTYGPVTLDDPNTEADDANAGLQTLFEQWTANIRDVARPAIQEIAATRQGSVVIDLQSVLDANPHLRSSDGIHLASVDGASTTTGQLPPTVPEASDIRQNFLWDGIAQARALRPAA